MIQEEDLAYIGGLMDGDGSFTLCRRRNNKGVSPLYFPLIQYGNLKRDPLDLLNKVSRGNIYFKKAHTKKDGSIRKDFYFWKLEKRGRCLPFLEGILPYLEIKNERAGFLKNFILNNPFVRGNNPLSYEILSSRENDYIKMKSFNDERSFGRALVKQTTKISHDTLFWAYFAGLLDSDGSFSIKKEKVQDYSAQVLLTMVDIRGINKIRKNIPFGTVFLVKALGTSLKSCYRFGIYSRKELLNFLPLIIPYLRIKKEQALVVLDFCKNKTIIKHRRGGIPLEEINFRESCYQKVLHLNKYGVFKPSLIDLEAREGDRAEGESHGERLSEMDSKEYATV